MKYYQLTKEEVLRYLQTSAEGLSFNEIEKRRKRFGKNILDEKKKKTALQLFIHQFKDIMILILFIAAVISFLIGDFKDALVILIIVFLNGIIGFIQEYRAEKALQLLKKMSETITKVKREGKIFEIPSSELVPGDIVLLEAGMQVPADIRLIEVYNLRTNEASLTGESNEIEKNSSVIQGENLMVGDQQNMAFKNTVVTYGRAVGVVVATGMQTEIGKIAKMLEEEDVQTPLQKRLKDFGKKLTWVVLVVCGLIYIVGLIRGEDPIQMLLTAISVAVAAIPEALPAVITISLAIGARRMFKRNTLIRKLVAVETLGSVTCICSDKTGTITQNKMKVTDVWINNQTDEVINNETINLENLFYLALSLNHDVQKKESKSNKIELSGDSTEVAIVEYLMNTEIDVFGNLDKFERINEIPFDSVRKRMTTINQVDGKWLVVCKGAVESVLNTCKSDKRFFIEERLNKYAGEGKRVLGYAFKLIDNLPDKLDAAHIEVDMNFLGMVAMMDPPREEVIQAIQHCYEAGIIPIMITGDHRLTAEYIAREVGILKYKEDKVITGTELENLNDEEFEKVVESIKVYSRVSPEQKLRIIKALQKRKHFVAMTGDGVNDAPALKQANIGIAMGITGTDVSKEAAHMILLDDNFATIVEAVKEGRRIYDNIRKFIRYTMTSNSGEIWTIFLALLFGLPVPLLPIHILWINLVTDGWPGLALSSEPAEINILKRPPRKQDEGIFSGGMGTQILWVGLLMGVICILSQYIFINASTEKWRTIVFMVLCLSQMGNAMAIRSESESIFTQGFLSNKLLLYAILLTFGLQLMIVYIPFLQSIFKTEALSLWEMVFVLMMSSVVFFAIELDKMIKRIKK
ncbi:MAG: ATPase [Bacteroidia bacterium]|nr:MAG: ATPase [Bacteroidia bacterium]